MLQSLSFFSAFYLVKIQPRNLPFPYIEHRSTLGSFSPPLTYVEIETVITDFYFWKTQFGWILRVSEFISEFFKLQAIPQPKCICCVGSRYSNNWKSLTCSRKTSHLIMGLSCWWSCPHRVKPHCKTRNSACKEAKPLTILKGFYIFWENKPCDTQPHYDIATLIKPFKQYHARRESTL